MTSATAASAKPVNVEQEMQFIQLRSQGRSFVSIAAEMHISKGKALEMGKRLHLEVGLETALVRQLILERYKVASANRASAFAEVLGAALNELHRRLQGEGAGLAQLKIGELVNLAAFLEKRLQAEEVPAKVSQGWGGDSAGFEDVFLEMR